MYTGFMVFIVNGRVRLAIFLFVKEALELVPYTSKKRDVVRLTCVCLSICTGSTIYG